MPAVWPRIAVHARVPIMRSVARRVHVPKLRTGDIPLDSAQAHHVRDVLRLGTGATVEVFDDGGGVAPGVLILEGTGVSVRVDQLEVAPQLPGVRWVIASAVPKGDRADWMVEKLSELGAAAFIPLATARSVVLPEGRNKRERWARIATESAKQSKRRGVMRIEELTPLSAVVANVADATSAERAASAAGESTARPARGWYLSTAPGAVSIGHAIRDLEPSSPSILTLFVGPEGGWAAEEMDLFKKRGLRAVSLTSTILRVETAAVAAAAVVSVLGASSAP
jgi:16S rRNA (uracil1498-N3)-methyltransferase